PCGGTAARRTSREDRRGRGRRPPVPVLQPPPGAARAARDRRRVSREPTRQWQPVSGSKRRAAAGLLPAQRGNDDRRRPHQLKRNGPAGKTGAEVMSYTRSYYRKEKGPQPADGGGPGGLTQLPYTDSRPPGRAPDVITDQPHR